MRKTMNSILYLYKQDIFLCISIYHNRNCIKMVTDYIYIWYEGRNVMLNPRQPKQNSKALKSIRKV